MKIGIILSLALFSSITLAEPSVFGMELGKTTETQLKEKHRLNHTGTNKYTNGNMYSVPTSGIDFSGLKEVTAIFNTNGKLMAVLTTLPKSKYDYLKKALGGKYKLTNEKKAFVGDKSSTYRSGSTEITLEAPHMSFDMTMNYITDELNNAYNNKSENERKKKRDNEASQL
ncbi:MAG: hypothetical protein COA86_17490 [Kangiella sp.]|nr:MAG: hypothetical protein COA86_17490 [Kangiella sp.]